LPGELAYLATRTHNLGNPIEVIEKFAARNATAEGPATFPMDMIYTMT